MVVDRGGVRYPIEIKDRFSDPLLRLRAQLRSTRKEFRLLRIEAAKSRRVAARAGAGGRGGGRGRGGGGGRSEAERQETESLRRLQAAFKEREKVERIRAAARKNEGRERAKQAASEVAEQNRRARAFANQVRARDIAEKQRGRIFRQMRKDQRAAVVTTKRLGVAGARSGKKIRKGFRQANRSGRTLISTTKRLLGAFALFSVARLGANLFTDMIKSGFQFNQVVEQSRLGIAGILVSVSNITDEQGRQLKGAEAFAAAQIIAAEQQRKLLADAQLTTATYEELLVVFQRALGPGTAGGLQADQIRELSVLISQAATAVGLAQNQLDEEIRALFTGNIRTNTTRLAQIVGLTNKDIRETADLYELLRSRLIGFRLAADDQANTIVGLARRIQGALQIVAGGAAINAFETLRSQLKGVFTALVQVERGANGAISAVTPSPAAITAFTAVFDSVNRLIIIISRLGQEVGFAGLQTGAEILASAIDFVGVVGIFTFEAIAGSLATIRTILNPIIGFFKEMRDTIDEIFGTGAARAFAISLASAAIALATISLTLGGIRIAFKVIFAQTFGIGRNLAIAADKTLDWALHATSVGKAWKRSLVSLGLITAAVLILAVATKSIVEEILGVSLSWGDMLEIALASVDQMSTKFLGFTREWTTFLVVRAQQAFNSVLDSAKRAAKFLKGVFDFEINKSDALSRSDKQVAAHDARVAADALKKKNDALELRLTEATQRRIRINADADKKIGESIAKIKERIAKPVAPIPVAPDKKPTIGLEPEPGRKPQPKKFKGKTTAKTPKEKPKAKDEDRIDQLRIAQARLIAETQISAIKAQQLGSTREDAEIGAVRLAQAERELEIALARGTVVDLEQRLNELKRVGQGESARALQIETQILTIKKKQAEIDRQKALLNLNSASSLEGLARGVRAFGESIGTAFQDGFAIAQEGLQAFAATVSSVVADALNPDSGQGSADIKEKFSKLFGDIAQIIIAKLTDQAIAALIKFIISLTSDSAGGPAGTILGAVGGNTGGRVGRGGGASFAHASAPGYDIGGRIRKHAGVRRPRGLHRSDTAAIWAAPGEFMQPISAVRKYGLGFMEDVRTGALDPGVASAMTISTGASSSAASTTGKQGFASGGSIPRQQAVFGNVADTPTTADARAQQAFVVTSQQNARRLMERNVFRRMMRENRDTTQS